MAAKLVQTLLKQLPLSRKRRKKAGFTLTELLVSILISGVVITALLSFVVDLVQTDRKEYARSETQREMQRALDFMVDDLREAVYIYDNLDQTRDGAAALNNYIPRYDGAVPVLAFWKSERLPYDKTSDRLPSSCADNDPECKQVITGQRAFSLVVYYQARNKDGDKWKGKSRIFRYVFRKYTNVESRNKTSGYVDPSDKSSFQVWPNVDGRPDGGATAGNGSATVLVDYVDDPAENKQVKVESCTSNDPSSPFYAEKADSPPYRRVPERETENTSFFVCVRTLTNRAGTSVQDKLNQDVFINIRGNTAETNAKNNKDPLLTLKTRAVARGVVDKKP